MKRSKPAWPLALLLLLLNPASVLAESDCEDETKTWAECIAELLNRQNDAEALIKKSATEGANATEVPQRERSWESLIGSATASELNLEDFLSPLLANLDIDGLEDGEDGLRFKRNFPLTYGTLALDVQAKQAELFPALKMKLDEMDEDDLEEELSKEINNLDSVDINVSFSIDRFGEDNAIWWGRRFRTRAGAPTGYANLATKMFMMVKAPEMQASEKALQQALDQVNKLIQQSKPVDPNKPKTIGNTQQDDRTEIKAAIERFAAAEKADFTAFSKPLDEKKDSQYFKFGNLVANQPQFVVTANYSLQDELVGRDSWGATLKYEVGQANVNGLRRYCKKKGGFTLENYAEFLGSQDKALQKNWRISFTGSYKWVDSYDYMSPDNAVTLSLDESQEWDVSLAAGRSIRLTRDGTEVNRFDLEAKYQDVTGDTMKQGRLNATATFTQQINDSGLAFSTSLVYSNRPEFRGDVDEELSARAGLRFRLTPRKPKDTSQPQG
ncbi:MAG: hypothetical protein AAF560_02720 [Acidobacteriota bacterium]